MKRSIYFFFLLFPVFLYAQTDRAAYVGTAVHRDLETARSLAYKNMIEQITVFIYSSSDVQTSETADGINESSLFKTVTGSSMTLTDVLEEVSRDGEGNYSVKKSVSKESVKKYYIQRRERILQYLRTASQEATTTENQIRLNIVLKNLYSAMLERLLYPDTLNYSFAVTGGKQFASTYTSIQDALQYIIQQIVFTPVRKIEDDNIVYQYDVTADNKAAAGLRFNYYDGQGQTDTEVKNGKVKCTFYYQKKELSEKEVTAFIEYRFSDELPQELAVADTMLHNAKVNNAVTFILPGKKESKTGIAMTLPAPLNEIIAAGNNFESLMKVLKSLQKKSKIIVGNETDFGSLEGLYGLVVSKAGIEVVFKVEKGKRIDVRTGKMVNLSDYAGKPLTYVEMLK